MIDFNFINGAKFRTITGPRIQYHNTHDFWDIFSFFVKVRKDCFNTYTLITHNSDWSVGKALANMGVMPNEIPYNLRWFTQNVDVEHPQIESIPIGLENPEWHQKIQKTQKISYCMKHNAKYYLELCVVQFNPSTNPRRQLIMDHFAQFDWCRTVPSINGTDFDVYLENLNNSTFCVCPDGNGIDTHRLWEALYVGCIPIVEDSINVRFYEELPIFICDDFTDITYDSLKYVKQKMMEKINDMNMQMLSFDYWKAKILGIEI
jgi:hypothetical protein